MKTNSFRTAASRWLQGAAAASVALGLAAWAPLAHAQAGTLSNPNNCSSFTGFTWNNGVLALTCSPPVQQQCTSTAASTFAFVSETGADVPAGGNSVGTYRRTGCAGQFTITFGTNAGTVAGTTASATTLTWADGESGDKTITFTTSTSTPLGKVGAWVTGYTSSTNSAPAALGGSYVFNVVAASSGNTGGNTPPPGCTTTATYNVTAVNQVQFFAGTAYEPGSLPPLKAGESIAASFTYQPTASWMQIAAGQVTNPAAGGTPDIEVNVDACPGNFTATADTGCSKRVTYPNTADPIVYGTTNGAAFGVCPLVAGQKYYINVRQVMKSYAAGSQPSCTNSAGCALRMQPQNLN